MAEGLRSSVGVASPPFTKGPYTWDQDLTITGSFGVVGTTTMTGDLNVSGDLDVNGNFIFGDAISDSITCNGLLKMGTNSVPLVLTAGTPTFTLYTTNAGTSGSTNAEPFYVKSVMTGIGQVGGRAKFELNTDVRLGGWANALKALVKCNTNGGSTGLISAVCSEMELPASTTGAGFSCLELEMTCPASGYTGSTTESSLIFVNSSGITSGAFDDYGVFMHFQSGLVAGAGHLLSSNKQSLKVGFGTNFSSGYRYLVMSQAEDTLSLTGVGITLAGNPTTAITLSATPTTQILISGASTTGISITGTVTNGILFTGLPIMTGANKNGSYFGIGTYGAHLSLDLSAANASYRAYLMQLMVDSIADDTSGNYLMGFYPRINITTADQPNISFSALSPSITATQNFKAIRCLKSEVDISSANVTTTLEGVYAVSGYLNLGTAGTLTGGGTSVATGIFDIQGGTGMTLSGVRTFAIFGNVYTGSTVTGIANLRADGTAIVTSGLTMECGSSASITNAFEFNACGGFTYLIDFEGVYGMVSTTSGATTPTHKVAVNVGGDVRYIKLYSDA